MSLVVGDSVKGQNPCVLVQVDSNPPGLRRAQELFLTIVPEGKTGAGPVQAPGESIVTQTATVVGAFTRHLPVSHRDGDLSRRKKEREAGGQGAAGVPEAAALCGHLTQESGP